MTIASVISTCPLELASPLKKSAQMGLVGTNFAVVAHQTDAGQRTGCSSGIYRRCHNIPVAGIYRGSAGVTMTYGATAGSTEALAVLVATGAILPIGTNMVTESRRRLVRVNLGPVCPRRIVRMADLAYAVIDGIPVGERIHAREAKELYSALGEVRRPDLVLHAGDISRIVRLMAGEAVVVFVRCL